MEHTDQILQYLKGKGASLRVFQIVKGSGIARRAVFKALTLLRKRGQVKREGVHPKIFYSFIPGSLNEEVPEVEDQKSMSVSQAPAPKKKLVRPKSSVSPEDWYALQNELNRVKVALKSAQATIKYQEEVIETLKAKVDRYMTEANQLRMDLLKPGRRK